MRNKINPYRGSIAPRYVVAGTDIPHAQSAADGRSHLSRSGRGFERLASADGEINAFDKKDLMRKLAMMIDQASRSMITTQRTHVAASAEEIEAKVDLLRTAFADRTGDQFQVVGETIGDQIYETLGREGFARTIYMVNPITKGGIGRLRVRQKDVVAIHSTTAINVDETVIRQAYVFPGEFELAANIMIDLKELEQATGDLMEEKFTDGLEAILVQEDKVLKRQLDTASTVVNTLTFFDTLTPAVFSSLKTQVGEWGLPVTTCLLAYDLWNDVISGDEFSGWFDPVSKHELILEGRLGSLLDVQIITDAFRHDTLKVLERGEIYFTAAPQALGGITQRYELKTMQTDKFNLGIAQRGWFMVQAEGMACVNTRGVSKGQRA